MMNNADTLITALSPALDRKCAELRQARREALHFRLFVLLCALVVLIPTVFVILGIGLVVLLIPALFTAAAFLILSPILINQQGGGTCEQI